MTASTLRTRRVVADAQLTVGTAERPTTDAPVPGSERLGGRRPAALKTRAAVGARRRRTLVDVRLTARTCPSRHALAPRAHARSSVQAGHRTSAVETTASRGAGRTEARVAGRGRNARRVDSARTGITRVQRPVHAATGTTFIAAARN